MHGFRRFSTLLTGVMAALVLTASPALALPHTLFADSNEWVESPNQLRPSGSAAWAMHTGEIDLATAWELMTGYPQQDVQWCLSETSDGLCLAFEAWPAQPLFFPHGTMTREGFAAMLVRVLALDGTVTSVPFSDVPEGAWYSDAIARLHQAGVLRTADRADGTLGVGQPISRAELAAWLARAAAWYGISAPTADLQSFDDAHLIPESLRADVAKAVALGILRGVGDNRLDPTTPATRVQVAAMMVRTLRHFDQHPPAMSELAEAVTEALTVYRDEYERMRDSVLTGQYIDYGHYIYRERDALRRTLSPYFSKLFIGPFYFIAPAGYEPFIHGMGDLTLPNGGFTVLNDYMNSAVQVPSSLDRFAVIDVAPVYWPDGSGPMILDNFAKVRVTLHIENHIPRLNIDSDYTRIMDLYLKRQDGRWVITGAEQISVQ